MDLCLYFNIYIYIFSIQLSVLFYLSHALQYIQIHFENERVLVVLNWMTSHASPYDVICGLVVITLVIYEYLLMAVVEGL